MTAFAAALVALAAVPGAAMATPGNAPADATSRQWFVLPPLGFMYEEAAATSGDRLYVIGGDAYDGFDEEDQPLASVSMYDPQSDSWVARAPLAVPRYSAGAATTADGRIVVAGGRSTSGLISSVEVYAPQTDSWSEAAPLPSPRAGVAMTTGLDGRIYAIGGFDGTSALRDVLIYSPASGTWTSTTPLAVARAYASAVTLPDGRIALIGGFGSSTVDVYAPRTQRWSTVSTMPSGVGSAAALGVDGRIYAYGAGCGVAALDLRTRQWSAATPLPAVTPDFSEYPCSWYDATPARVGSVIYALTGCCTTQYGDAAQSVAGLDTAHPRDRRPPTAPRMLPPLLHGDTITLRWQPSYDRFGVARYELFHQGMFEPTPFFSDSLSSAVTTLSFPAARCCDDIPLSRVTYSVRARDGAGNASASTSASYVVPLVDGFEDGTLDAWHPVAGFTVESTLVRAGTWAARAQSTGSAAAYAQRCASGDALRGVRIEAAVDAVSAASNAPLLAIADANGRTLARLERGQDGRLGLVLPQRNRFLPSATTLAAGSWHTLALELEAGSAARVQALLDGSPIPGLGSAVALGLPPACVRLADRLPGRSFATAYDDVRVTATPGD